ncbi:hypothetical protein OG589_41535 [Sphaerisporangium sp. NBC_01403]|uniref:hypothetical protein n=1 Tax=Sphaerisporangium sp. NBC_01403 TaxID=2903599 RepID=UPI00324BA950
MDDHTPSPATGAALEFSVALRSLYEAAERPLYKILIRQANLKQPSIKLTHSSLSDWLAGRTAPSSQEAVRFLVDFLEARAGKRGYVVRGPKWWEQRWEAAVRARRPNRGGRPARRRTDEIGPEPVQEVPPLGWPIAELRPADLEVHPAITVGEAAHEVGELPLYLPRRHDARLAEIVDGVRGGNSAIAVLVGGSSTGKTRACWEAIQRLGEPWRLWHPTDPGPPRAALAGLAAIGPHTVVWLNETQRYLLTAADAGEKIAAGLRDILRTGERGPVLIVGTLWPRFWDELTSVPEPGNADVHAQARELLKGNMIDVPATFTPEARDPAIIARDPRLTEAAERSTGDGHLTQYLAGGPAVLDRYRAADVGERALLDAAIDARRLGHGRLLPRVLLEEAAEGYLSDQQLDTLSDHWLERAFAYATDHNPCRGARAPLTVPRRRRTAQRADEGQVLYAVSDYLHQMGYTERQAVAIPAGVWDALIGHADCASLAPLGQEAETRSLYHCAFRLYVAAAEAGYADGLDLAISLLRKLDRTDEAIVWLQERSTAGDDSAVGRAAQLMDDHGHGTEALAWLRRLAEAGNHVALGLAVDRLMRADHGAEAIGWAQMRAQAGAPGAALLVAELLCRAGRIDDAAAYYRYAIQPDPAAAPWRSIDPAQATCLRDDALAWLRIHADTEGDLLALRLMASACRRQERIDEAFGYYQRVAEAGDVYALWVAAGLLKDAGRVDTALGCYQRLAVMDAPILPDPLGDAVELLRDSGRDDEVIGWLQFCAESGNVRALKWAVVLLGKEQRTDEAIEWLKARTTAGDPLAPRLAGELLRQAGDIHSAQEYFQHAAAAGDRLALQPLAELLQQTGHLEEALTVYRHAAATDSTASHRRLTLLLNEGRVLDAIAWLQECAQAGEPMALDRLVDLCRRHGQLEKALVTASSLSESGDLFAMAWAVGLLKETQGVDAAIAWLQRSAKDGNVIALDRVSEMLQRQGRQEEALDWLRARAEAGEGFAVARAAELMKATTPVPQVLHWLRERLAATGHFALTAIGDLLGEEGESDAALTFYLRAAEAGDPEALSTAVELLQAKGHGDAANRLRRYGITPGATIDQRWRCGTALAAQR